MAVDGAVAGIPVPKEGTGYTYADFLSWEEDFLTEIIDGRLYRMSSPGMVHQEVVGALIFRLHEFKKKNLYEVFYRIGVRLFPKNDLSDDTVVIPDFVVVSDHSKINKQGCNGVPDMVVEVISPSSVRHDRVTKFRLYQRAGIKEYWIADPESRVVEVHRLQNGVYVTETYDETEAISVSALSGCVIPLGEVFSPIESGET